MVRFISGVVIGVVLTFGVAYLVDATRSAPGPDGHGARRMVNWDVVGDDVQALSSGVQNLWARTVGDAKTPGKQGDKPGNG